MPKKEPLFTFRLTRPLLSLLALSSGAASAFLERCGMPASAAEQACTVPLSRVKTLLDEAAILRKDPLIGLTLAAAVPEGTYEEAELLVRTAPTIGAGLAALASYAELINPIGSFRFVDSESAAKLHYRVAGQRDGLGRHMNEYTIAYVLRGLRLLVDAPLVPREVWFAHERDDDAPLVARFFDCPVRFGASDSGLAFSSDVSQRALVSKDRVVFDFLAKRAEKSRRERAPAPFSAIVALAIEEAVGFAGADLSAVARHLALTERTVQRRLSEEGTSFREVLDQLRRRHADELVTRGVPVDQIARQLGFADAKSYRQAARRWSAGDA